MKKTFTLTCLILASVIGAGFASGKEIQVFFTKYGVVSFFAIILAYFMLSWVFKKYLMFGNRTKPKSFFETTNILFGKYSKLINGFIIVCYFIVLAGMFAGVYEVYLNLFQPSLAKILVIATVLLTALENCGGISIINIINNIFIPITMIILIISAILNFNGANQIVFTTNLNTSISGILAVLSYVGVNILLVGSMLVSEGKNYTEKNIKYASKFSSFVLVTIMFLFNIVLLKNNVNTSMPMLSLSFEVSWWWGVITLGCVWFSIYSAITSVTFVLSNSVFQKSKGFTSNLMVSVIAYIVSLFGFDKIVEVLYPIIGLVGIIYSLVLIFKLRKFKTTMQTKNIGLIK